MGTYIETQLVFGFRIKAGLALAMLREEVPKHYPGEEWTDAELVEHAGILPLPLDFDIGCGVPDPEANIIECPFYLGLAFYEIELAPMQELLDTTKHPDFAKVIELAVQLGASDPQPAIHAFPILDY